eukprot:960204-Pyramimonas_sp.AAC.1
MGCWGSASVSEFSSPTEDTRRLDRVSGNFRRFLGLALIEEPLADSGAEKDPEGGPIDLEERVYTWRGDQSTERKEYPLFCPMLRQLACHRRRRERRKGCGGEVSVKV